MHRRSVLTGFLLLIAPALAVAAEPEIFTGLVPGVGAGGYDAVSYFSGKPAKGDAKYSTTWKNATWQFSSADNLKAFEAAPEKYAPQYGGYCAYALSKGALAKGDPEAWTVHDGKLFLNFSKSVRDTWSADIPGNITAANTHWPKVLK